MEIFGGILIALSALVVLAAIGVTTVAAFALMAVLGLLTELSFKRVFLISFAVGLLVPILLAAGLLGAVQDGSLERELRDELGEVVQLPDDMGDKWREALPRLQELSREREAGNLSDEEAERRFEEIIGGFDDFQIGIDVDGDGVVIGDTGAGVPLQLPEPVEAAGTEGNEGQ